MIVAQAEAGRLRHDFVGAEHILLGLIRDGEGIAIAVLQRLGLRLETVKADVERALAEFPKTLTFGEVPFTPQAKRVLELSMKEARQLGHPYIGTEHLLLGLMKEEQSSAARILESLGARLDEVRQETFALLGHQDSPRHRTGPDETPRPRVFPWPISERLWEIARQGAREAERKALAEVLGRVNWNRAEAARTLKVSYKTLLNKISECGLTRPEKSSRKRTPPLP
jgi:ATP-dependent Clp protease ATP-binding subunit ClpA